MPAIDLGQSIPPDTAHAVSVSLPTWRSNVGYEEGESWVVNRMTTGYPRFFIHKSITALAESIVSRHGQPGQQAMLFPTSKVARRCLNFVRKNATPSATQNLEVLDLVLDTAKPVSDHLKSHSPSLSAVLISDDAFPTAKQYWQHTGDGTSSRRAEFCHELFREGLLVPASRPQSPTDTQRKACRGPRRYQRQSSIDATFSSPLNVSIDQYSPTNGTGHGAFESQESLRFLEERYGRNLDLSLVERAKSAIKRRIAGALIVDMESKHDSLVPMNSNSRGLASLEESDVYLFPCGMNAIFNTHQAMLRARGEMKSINFGFPYVDTLKILEKFGPGCAFFGHATSADLDDLEHRLLDGERFLALFCEFPGNPLLTCPDLVRIRQLADRFDFGVVVDETIGTFVNVNVLQFADVVVSSLTKIFSGDCNVMGGSAILNPDGRYYADLKAAMELEFEDNYWLEDIVFMERNSRDFASRIERTNRNSEAICEVLAAHSSVKTIYYPKLNPSRSNYDACRLPGGGYGGLLSVTFHNSLQAVAFYDALETAKGPSLGTNFTLTSPYVLLAHYQELSWASQFGVEPDLIRISVGLEETDELKAIFGRALEVVETVKTG